MGPWKGLGLFFDHAKSVKDWTTTACPICDLYFRWIMTTITCDMQLEDYDSQCMLWFGIIELTKKHGVNGMSFHGFMVENAQTNLIGVKRVFCNKNSNELMEDMEKTCEFHQVQSL